MWSFTHRQAWWKLPGCCLLAMGQYVPGGLLRLQKASSACSLHGFYVLLVGGHRKKKASRKRALWAVTFFFKCVSTSRSQQDPRPRRPPGAAAPAPLSAQIHLLSKSVLSSPQGLLTAAASAPSTSCLYQPPPHLYPPPPKLKKNRNKKLDELIC